MATIRPARSDDVPAIQHVARTTWHAAYDDLLGPDAVDAKVDEWYADGVVADGITDDTTTYLVATDDEVIGYAFGSPLDDDVASLSAIYVLPDRWGSGVGSQLFDAVTDRLHDRGVVRLRIRVLADNDRAREFYERHGATLVDRQRIELAGVTVAEVTYECDL
jgi:ribosomal protein S18 acetylase RimI-like enzyme